MFSTANIKQGEFMPTKNLSVDENLAETIAEAIDWLEAGTKPNTAEQKCLDSLKDWIHENFHDVAADHWYFSKCLQCKEGY